MPIATVHVLAAELEFAGAYEETGDVLYLSTPDDDKAGQAQETPEGHAVRIDAAGNVTHLSVINARWLLDRDGVVVASLRDGRRLRLGPKDLTDVMGSS